jgi:hypothetical protein
MVVPLTADQAIQVASEARESGRNRYRIGIRPECPLDHASFGGAPFSKVSEKVWSDPATGETIRTPRRGLVLELSVDDLRRIVQDAKYKVVRAIPSWGKITRSQLVDLRSPNGQVTPNPATDRAVWIEPPAAPAPPPEGAKKDVLDAYQRALAEHEVAVQRAADRSLIYIESNPVEETQLPTTFEQAIAKAQEEGQRRINEQFKGILAVEKPEALAAVQKTMRQAQLAGMRVSPTGEVMGPRGEQR